MKVKVEEMRKVIKKIDDFNRLKLEDIEFYLDGKKLNFSNELYDDFSYTGLCNIDFIKHVIDGSFESD